jgi:hypothetical protein
MIDHLVFFLEGPSEKDFLESLWSTVMPTRITPHFQVFQGKQDLEKQLVRRMKYWLKPNSRLIVMRDQDSGDCMTIKARLRQLCDEAGQPTAVIRIACRELETFFVGDWTAIAAGFGKPALATLAKKAKYRTPDELGNPADEIKRHIPSYQKREGARKIAPHLRAVRNKSPSFQVLMRTLEEMAAG